MRIGSTSTLRLALSSALLLVALGLAASDVAAAGLQVGAAAVNFEADDSMVIAGGIGPWKPVGQEGQLRAVAIVLAHPTDGRFAIVACDVLFVTGEMVDRTKSAIGERLGIPPEHVLINATHTHSAPSTVRVHGYGPEPVFIERVVAGIVEAVERATKNLVDNCRFYFAQGEEETVGMNSRLLMSDGTIYWVGPRDDAVRPTGPFDPELPIWAFKGADDKLLALIYNHSTHTIGGVKPNVRSPAFYGLAAQELESELGCAVSFLEGASGSTHNYGDIKPAEAVVRMKNAVRQALSQAERQEVPQVRALLRPFSFAIRTIDETAEDGKVADYCRKRIPQNADDVIAIFRTQRRELRAKMGQERKTSLQVILVGDVALVGVPAEFFTKLGLDIKERSPFPHTYIAELANDWIGYIPDREAYDLGGYQTWMGHHSYAEPGTGERMVDQVLKMLDELKPAHQED
ncbi:MAG: hypothetical protein K2Y37_22960 [Pirellulales bacterium]|nr:hypothetical protein [Pirellulales bacterium]